MLCSALPAQTVSIIDTQLLPIDAEGYYPQFSPDDQKIYYSSQNYKGLWEYDLLTESQRTLTTDWGAGYQFMLTPDGRRIIYRCDHFDRPKKRSSIVALDLKNAARQILQPLETEVSPPQPAGDGRLFYTIRNSAHTRNMNSTALAGIPRTVEPIVNIENQKMALYYGEEKTILDPIPGGSYFWQSLSPDKKKILFTEARKGTFIADLQGAILVNLGKANYPQWSPDGKWVCFMDDHDDGRNFIASDIYIVSAQGGARIPVTDTADRIEMFPRWANTVPDKIVFHTDDGKLFLVEFTIEE